MTPLTSFVSTRIQLTRPFLTLALALALTGGATTSVVQAQDAPVEQVRPVKLMTVVPNGGGVTRQFFGQVVARQSVDLAFQVAGQVIEFPVIEGQIVPKGGLIAKLDQEPFELQLGQAKLQFEQAERTLERFNQLTGSAVSKVTVEDAETQLGLSRIAQRNAEYALENATLTAPFDAMVASRNVANYTTVGAGNPVVRLHDMSDLRIEIDVPEVLFQRAGQESDVTLMARFPASDELYPVAVREFVAEASTVGQTFQLTLGLDRPEGITLLPGSSATILATINDEGGQPLIPSTAVRVTHDGQTEVMVFTPNGASEGVVQSRAVTLSPNRDGAFQLMSGLELGEEIVMTGAVALQDGQTVRRFVGFAD